MACETERVFEKSKEINYETTDSSPSFWNCQFCEAKNKIEYSQCRNCHKMNLQNLPFSPEEEEDTSNKWQCIACTYFNSDDLIDCSLCGHSRIKIIDYKPDEEERPKKIKDNRGYLELVEASNAVLMPNTQVFYCIICMTNCDPGEGVVLSECLHQFCRYLNFLFQNTKIKYNTSIIFDFHNTSIVATWRPLNKAPLYAV